jgi:hypothetical protein
MRNVSPLIHTSVVLRAGGELRGGEPAGFPLAGTCTFPIVHLGGSAIFANISHEKVNPVLIAKPYLLGF